MNLCRNSNLLEMFKVNKYFVTIVGPHFQWLEFGNKIYVMTGKQCIFLPKSPGKGNYFL